MNYFGFDIDQPNPVKCCDVCSGIPQEEFRVAEQVKPDKDLSLRLQYYFQCENSGETSHCLSHLHTGLDKHLADVISSNPGKYVDESALSEEFPYLKPLYVSNIKIVLQSYLGK